MKARLMVGGLVGVGMLAWSSGIASARSGDGYPKKTVLVNTPPQAANGPIKVFIHLTGDNKANILITGAIGDNGTTVEVNAAGKPSSKGNYELLKLTKGTLLVNATAFNNAVGSIPTVTPDFDAATCSGSGTTTAPVTFVSGTKAYKGVSGTVNLTATLAFYGPYYIKGPKKGTCNTGNSDKDSGHSYFFGVAMGTGSVGSIGFG